MKKSTSRKCFRDALHHENPEKLLKIEKKIVEQINIRNVLNLSIFLNTFEFYQNFLLFLKHRFQKKIQSFNRKKALNIYLYSSKICIIYIEVFMQANYSTEWNSMEKIKLSWKFLIVLWNLVKKKSKILNISFIFKISNENFSHFKISKRKFQSFLFKIQYGLKKINELI